MFRFKKQPQPNLPASSYFHKRGGEGSGGWVKPYKDEQGTYCFPRIPSSWLNEAEMDVRVQLGVHTAPTRPSSFYSCQTTGLTRSHWSNTFCQRGSARQPVDS